VIAARAARVQRSLVRWGFNRLYRELAWAYDIVAWLVSRGYWRRWALAALCHLAPGGVIELGCGTGTVQRALATSGRAHVGLDASPQMLRITRARLLRGGASPQLARALAQALPLRSGVAANVVATFPTEYILHPQTLAEVRRVLSPGGRLLIVDGAQFTRAGLYERAVDLAYRLTLQGSVRPQPEELPAHDTRLDALARAGLRVSPQWETVGASRVLVLVGEYGPDA
jgi:ubiquinone/menaquinone biosynthesis C-methylase UbiE